MDMHIHNKILNVISAMLMKIIQTLIRDFDHLGHKHKIVDCGTIVSCNDFKTVCPLFRFDVSKHESNVYRRGSTADIEIRLLLYQVSANPYNIHSVIFSEREAITEVIYCKLFVNI